MAIYVVEKLVDGVMVLELRGRIILGPETEAVRSKIKALLEAGTLHIVLDLENIIYVDSVGLSTLISSYTSARKAGGYVKLLHLPHGVRHLLQVTRLITVFDVYEDLHEAVRSFGASDALRPLGT